MISAKIASGQTTQTNKIAAVSIGEIDMRRFDGSTSLLSHKAERIAILLLGLSICLFSLTAEQELKVRNEPLRLCTVFGPRPLHLPADEDCPQLGGKVCVAVGEELVPD